MKILSFLLICLAVSTQAYKVHDKKGQSPVLMTHPMLEPYTKQFEKLHEAVAENP